jgi:hypothetical protein
MFVEDMFADMICYYIFTSSGEVEHFVEKLIHFVPEPQQRRYVCRYNLLLYFPELRRSEMFVEDMFVEAMLAKDILPATL